MVSKRAAAAPAAQRSVAKPWRGVANQARIEISSAGWRGTSNGSAVPGSPDGHSYTPFASASVNTSACAFEVIHSAADIPSCGGKDVGAPPLSDGSQCLQMSASNWVPLLRNSAQSSGVEGLAGNNDSRPSHRSVDDGDDSRNHGNVVSLQASRIASPIHAFVMV